MAVNSDVSVWISENCIALWFSPLLSTHEMTYFVLMGSFAEFRDSPLTVHKIKEYICAFIPDLQQWLNYIVVEINAWMANRTKQKTMGYINLQCSSLACALLGKQAIKQYTTRLHLYSSRYSRAVCQHMGTGAHWYLHSTQFMSASVFFATLVHMQTGALIS